MEQVVYNGQSIEIQTIIPTHEQLQQYAEVDTVGEVSKAERSASDRTTS